MTGSQCRGMFAMCVRKKQTSSVTMPPAPSLCVDTGHQGFTKVINWLHLLMQNCPEETAVIAGNGKQKPNSSVWKDLLDLYPICATRTREENISTRISWLQWAGLSHCVVFTESRLEKLPYSETCQVMCNNHRWAASLLRLYLRCSLNMQWKE